MTFWKRLFVPAGTGGAVAGVTVEVGVGVEVSGTEGRASDVLEFDGSGDSTRHWL